MPYDTEWPNDTHMSENLVIIGSDSDLVWVQHQTTAWTNAVLSSISPLGTHSDPLELILREYHYKL